MEVPSPSLDTNKNVLMDPNVKSTAEFGVAEDDTKTKPHRGMSFKDLVLSRISGGAVSLISKAESQDDRNTKKKKKKRKKSTSSDSSQSDHSSSSVSVSESADSSKVQKKTRKKKDSKSKKKSKSK